MKRNIVFLSIMSILFVACGSNSTSQTSNLTKESVQPTSKTITSIAKDHLMRDVVKSFNSYEIKVLADKVLDEDSISKDTFAVYGTIDGQSTDGLLKLNTNYPKGTHIIVEVLKAGKTIGKSKSIAYTSDPLNFGTINIK